MSETQSPEHSDNQSPDTDIAAPIAKKNAEIVDVEENGEDESISRENMEPQGIAPIWKNVVEVSDEYLKKYKQGFLAFSGKSGVIQVDPDLPLLLRGLLKNPRMEQLDEWTKQLDPSATDTLNLDQFMCLMRQPELQDVDSEQELRECFGLFDPALSGTMSVSVLRNILTLGSNELSNSEIEDLIKEMHDDDNPGIIDYEKYIKTTLSNITPLIPLKKSKKKKKKKETK